MFRAHVPIVRRAKLYDTRVCIIQFWPPDDEHMCSKHVEGWNKVIIKFSSSSWWVLINCKIMSCFLAASLKFGFMVFWALLRPQYITLCDSEQGGIMTAHCWVLRLCTSHIAALRLHCRVILLSGYMFRPLPSHHQANKEIVLNKLHSLALPMGSHCLQNKIILVYCLLSSEMWAMVCKHFLC